MKFSQKTAGTALGVPNRRYTGAWGTTTGPQHPGKLEGMQETKPPAPPRRARLVVPSRSDLLLRNFTELIGGPMGSRSAPGLVSPGVFTVERVLIILTVLAALAGILIKGYCRANGWESPSQFYSTCYSDFPELFRNRGLGDGTFPFFSQGSLFEYPVLMGLIARCHGLAGTRPGRQRRQDPRLLRRQRHADRRRLDCYRAGHRTDVTAAAVGRGHGGAGARHRPGRDHQLGHVGGRPPGAWHAVFLTGTAGAGRHPDRPGHSHQALPRPHLRCHPAPCRADQARSGRSWSRPAQPSLRGWPSTYPSQ